MSRPAVVFDQVSKVYSLSHQKTENLKDRLTRMLRGGKAPVQTQAETEAFYALKDVSFEIQPGESVGIIGPNGSGKSTSLKILAGVTKPSSGRFELNGRLGALIEVGAGFHPELTGRENVYMNGSILGMSKKEIDLKFDSIVDFSEIEQFIDTPVKHYSSGMYVRLGFAVAIHNEPEVMLVDEVLAVGDLGFQKKCFARMEALKNEGRTFILVSHSMGQIQEMCKRAIMLKKGKVVADDEAVVVSGRYIELMNEKKTVVVNPEQQESIIRITGLEIMDESGNRLSQMALGDDIIVRIEYEAVEAIENMVVVLNVKRPGVKVYEVHSDIQKIKFSAHVGKSEIHCRLPKLHLMPNTYGLDVLIWNSTVTSMLARKIDYESFVVMPPNDPFILGCRLYMEPTERPPIYGHTRWEQK